jgi:fibronectin type 3 domain-containing protein
MRKFNFIIFLVLLIFSCKVETYDFLEENTDTYHSSLYVGSYKGGLKVPDGVQASVNRQDGIELSWNVVKGAYGYNIYRSVSEDGDYVKIKSDFRGTDFFDIISYPEDGDKEFYYKVSVLNDSGVESNLSKKIKGIVKKYTLDVETSGIVVEPATDNGIVCMLNVKWDVSTSQDVAYFKIYRISLKDIVAYGLTEAQVINQEINYDDSEYPIENILPEGNKVLATEKEFIDNISENSIVPGDSYYYWVVPFSSADVAGYSGQPAKGSIPEVPEIAEVSQGDCFVNSSIPAFKITWTYGGAAGNFYVYISKSRTGMRYRLPYSIEGYESIAGFTGEREYIFPSNQKLTFTDNSGVDYEESIETGRKYYFHVSAKISDDVETVSSEPVRGFVVGNGCPKPTSDLLQVTSGAEDANGAIKVEWENSMFTNSPDSFSLLRSEDLNGFFGEVTKIPSENISNPDFAYAYDDTTIESGKTYYYVLQAENDEGFGGYSEAVKGLSLEVPSGIVHEVDNSSIYIRWNIFSDANVSSVSIKRETVSSGEIKEFIVGGTSFKDSDSLVAGESYKYDIRSVDATKTIYSKSAVAGGYEIVMRPQASFGSYGAEKGVVDTVTGIGISWPELTDSSLAGYNLYRTENAVKPTINDDALIEIRKNGDLWETDGFVIDSGVCSIYDNTAVPGSIYYYWISGVFVNGEDLQKGNISDFSQGYFLGIPQSLTATQGIYNDQIVYTWPAVYGADGYKVYIVTGSGDELMIDLDADYSLEQSSETLVRYIYGNNGDGDDETDGNDSSLSLNVQVSIKVSAVSTFGESELSGQVTGMTKDPSIQTLDVPSNIHADMGSFCKKITLSWDPPVDVTEIVHYEITRTGGGVDITYLCSETGLASYEYVNRDSDSENPVVPGIVYYYTIKSIAKSGSSYVDSPSSEIVSGSLMSPPQNIDASDGLYSDKIIVSWDAVTNAESYIVYTLDDSGQNEYTVIEKDPATGDLATSCDYLVDLTTAGVIVSFTVAAADSEGNVNLSTSSDSGYVLGIPSDLSASRGESNSKINCSWKGVDLADSYAAFVQKVGDSAWTEVSAAVNYDSELELYLADIYVPETSVEYSIKVLAVDSAGHIGFDPGDEGTYPKGYVLGAPEAISFANYGDLAGGVNGRSAEIMFEYPFDVVAESTGFNIDITYKAGSITLDNSKISSTGGNQYIATVNGLVPGTPYLVYISSTKETLQGESIESLESVMGRNKAILTPVFCEPELTLIHNGNEGSTVPSFNIENISEDGQEPIDDYRVYRSRYKNSGYAEVSIEEAGDFDDDDVPGAGVYFYRVAGLNKYGYESAYGELESYVIPSAVTGLKATVRKDLLENGSGQLLDRIKVYWDRKEGVDNYKIYTSKNSSDITTLVGTISQTGDSIQVYDHMEPDYGFNFYKVVPCLDSVSHGGSNPEIEGTAKSDTNGGARDITPELWAKKVVIAIEVGLNDLINPHADMEPDEGLSCSNGEGSLEVLNYWSGLWWGSHRWILNNYRFGIFTIDGIMVDLWDSDSLAWDNDHYDTRYTYKRKSGTKQPVFDYLGGGGQDLDEGNEFMDVSGVYPGEIKLQLALQAGAEDSGDAEEDNRAKLNGNRPHDQNKLNNIPGEGDHMDSDDRTHWVPPLPKALESGKGIKIKFIDCNGVESTYSYSFDFKGECYPGK